MSDPSASALAPALAYGLVMLVRALRNPAPPRAGARRSRPPVDPTPRLRRIVPPPPATDQVPHSKATLQLKWPLPGTDHLVVPVERWARENELLAWRFWKLGRLRPDGGIRLLSFRAPCVWDGPVLRAHRLPSESPFGSAGVYAVKAPPSRRADVHRSDECWVSGWVALSGRVVEHEHGYRAERAVIRRLRLGVGTHLRVTQTEDLLALAVELEHRYQAPVNLGQVERRFAARVLVGQEHLWQGGIPEIAEGVRVG